MTLLELLKELRDMGAIDRVRRVKCGDVELDLAAPIDTERKVVELSIPEPQQHGSGLSEEQIRIREEAEALAGLYGASQGWVPGDHGST